MALTSTARRMMDTLPSYYDGEPLIERIMQARANAVDRQDALLDRLAIELQPGAATDLLGLLGLWEIQMGLPFRPEGATVSQRQAKLAAALRKLDSGPAASVMETISAAALGAPFVITRDDPDELSDTIEIQYESDGYNAAQIEQIARVLWPAHRGLFMRYADGFLADISRLDIDVL